MMRIANGEDEVTPAEQRIGDPMSGVYKPDGTFMPSTPDAAQPPTQAPAQTQVYSPASSQPASNDDWLSGFANATRDSDSTIQELLRTKKAASDLISGGQDYSRQATYAQQLRDTLPDDVAGMFGADVPLTQSIANYNKYKTAQANDPETIVRNMLSSLQNPQQTQAVEEPNYRDQYKIASKILGNQWDENIEGAMKARESDLTRRGFYGQAPGTKILTEALGELKADKETAISQAAMSLLSQEKQQVYNDRALANQEKQSQISNLSTMLTLLTNISSAKSDAETAKAKQEWEQWKYENPSASELLPYNYMKAGEAANLQENARQFDALLPLKQLAAQTDADYKGYLTQKGITDQQGETATRQLMADIMSLGSPDDVFKYLAENQAGIANSGANIAEAMKAFQQRWPNYIPKTTPGAPTSNEPGTGKKIYDWFFGQGAGANP
jgi:hypothetical protein